MFTVRRALELVFFLMVILSSLLMGYSQDNWQLAAISAIGALVAWIIVDWLKWFQMPRWIANVLSVGVLVVTMKDFFSRDSSLQLISVANLLVYLQTILLFQEKQPRQYWQLSVLNLLQVVVATIFSLQFEGGFLFLCYMVLAGVMLMLITLEDEAFHIFLLNQHARTMLTREPTGHAGQRQPVLTVDNEFGSKLQLPGMLGHMGSWAAVSVCFAAVLFVLVPRSESAWFGPRFLDAATTGITRKVDLDVRGVIRTNSDLVFRARFYDPDSAEPIEFMKPSYFRGLALGSWGVENGNTVWKAPYDRLDRFELESLIREEPSSKYFKLEITMEPTTDPLLFSCMPCFLPNGEPDEIDFSRELSALTRKRETRRIEQSPFVYNLLVPKVNDDLPDSWPYRPESNAISAKSMAGNLMQREWLTQIDRTRYPQLVRVAREIVANANSDDHLLLAKRMESYFLDSLAYKYTLDFTDVPRQEGVDSIEDFFANHKIGHCELYASALVLMLRSEGIPAHLVVGFCGGSFNPWGKFVSVTNENAHAWVEVYIRPENCTDEMRAKELADSGGAWLRLDPTPSANLRTRSGLDSSQAFFLARSMWQEYVLGMDSRDQGMWTASGGFLGWLRLDAWSMSLQRSMSNIQQQPGLVTILAGSSILLILIATFRSVFPNRRKQANAAPRKIGLIRRMVGAAVSMIAPKLGKWLLKGADRSHMVPFYSQLLRLLERFGNVRREDETHWEFSRRVAEGLGQSLESNAANDAIKKVVGAFHLVRFGGTALDNQQHQAVEQELKMLENLLPQLQANSGESTRS